MDALDASLPAVELEGLPGTTRIGRDAATYALGGLAGKVAGVLLLPILSRALGPEGYGQLDVLNTIAATVPVILLFGMDAAALRLAFMPAWTARRHELLATWLAIVVVTMVGSGVVLYLTSSSIADLLFGSMARESSIRWLAAIVPLSLLSAFVLTSLRIAGRATLYALSSGTALVANGILTVVLVLGTGLGVDAALAAWAIALGLTTILTFASVSVTPRLQPHAAMTAMARYGAPLVPALVIVLAAELVNRAMLLLAAGATEVAYLSVGSRVASAIALLGTAFLLAWQPRAYAAAATAEGLQSVMRDACRFIAAAVVVAFGLTIAARPIVSVLAGPGFAASGSVVGVLSLAAFGLCLVPIVSIGSAVALRSHDIALATSAGAVVSVATNIVLASRFGAMGTAVSIAIGQGVAVLCAAFLSHRQPVPTPDLTRALVGAALGAFAVGGLTLTPEVDNVVVLVIAGLAAVASVAVLLGQPAKPGRDAA